ncbi:hypothetical protein HIM_02840 [Hirsutella minnesotensis 3608]|nr:hypothetical protein HIM_02840 [Hirsutella minnesotensis 3608]
MAGDEKPQRDRLAGDGSGPSSREEADPAPAYEEIAPSMDAAPTISEPFNFPSNAELPAYNAQDTTGSDAAGRSIIGIPQTRPDPAAPFVTAYPCALLGYGITEETWRSFLSTMSGFLTATVSDRAITHAGEIARQMGQRPKSFGKGVVSHAKSVGKNIANEAKRGNIIGAAFGVIGGVISLPIATALGAAGTATQLPAAALGALSSRPQTPLERASAYAVVANKEWFHARGLQARLVDSSELARLLGMSVEGFLGLAAEAKEDTAVGQLQALERHLSALKVQDHAGKLTLAASSLWMILTQIESREAASH